MEATASTSRYADVLIVGGGNAGIALGARLRSSGLDDVAIIEPKVTHHFRPLLSYVGAGMSSTKELSRRQASVMPMGVRWIQDAVDHIDVEGRLVTMASGATIAYRDVVLTPGSEPDWDAVAGSAQAMLSPSASTNYVVDLAPKTWELIQALRSGRAVFTLPDGPAPCPGAGQKILYMACDYWRSQGVLDDIEVTLVTPDADVSANAKISARLRVWVQRYGIQVLASSRVDRVDPTSQTLHVTGPDGSTVLPYDFWHMTPAHRAQPWIESAGLSSAEAAGYVDVDPLTLRHRRVPTVWSCGDTAETGASRSGGALREQTEVLAKNLLSARSGAETPAEYSGYSVCPYTVSRSKVLFAEFDRDRVLRPSFPLMWRRPSRVLFFGDRRVLPQIYWHRILKGK
ncbi:MAG: FAD/NAD(P)-binding oxidoreductase [Ornithinimicrobium sp.]